MIDDLMKHYGEHKDLFYDRLESALRTARNEALEEAAAKAADIVIFGNPILSSPASMQTVAEATSKLIAAQIRALKLKDGQP